MVAEFRIEDVNPSPAFFDVKKLRAFNGEYIRALSVDEFVGACQPWLAAEVAPWPAERFDPAKSETHDDRVVSHTDVALAGKIAGTILVEASQLVELNRHTGELRVETSGVTGYLRFKEGVIVSDKRKSE